eukprot:728535-Pyramimonas_sp.AAC.1
MAVALICLLNSHAFGKLEPPWGSLGVLVGPSWGPPGALYWGSLEVALGHYWGTRGAILGRLGALLGLFGEIWGPSWDSFGMSEGPPGAVLGHFAKKEGGPSIGPHHRMLKSGVGGPSWPAVGALVGALGA